nr:PREDICTED: uncharacterized protein LOC107983883 isoform X2 [Anolis carolinensis]|eukprot:XP_016854772.1 PREDICTED: uncharacterized protein LOC107983883 isoform X2 [Anolis carolinensis]
MQLPQFGDGCNTNGPLEAMKKLLLAMPPSSFQMERKNVGRCNSEKQGCKDAFSVQIGEHDLEMVATQTVHRKRQGCSLQCVSHRQTESVLGAKRKATVHGSHATSTIWQRLQHQQSARSGEVAPCNGTIFLPNGKLSFVDVWRCNSEKQGCILGAKRKATTLGSHATSTIWRWLQHKWSTRSGKVAPCNAFLTDRQNPFSVQRGKQRCMGAMQLPQFGDDCNINGPPEAARLLLAMSPSSFQMERCLSLTLGFAIWKSKGAFSVQVGKPRMQLS